MADLDKPVTAGWLWSYVSCKNRQNYQLVVSNVIRAVFRNYWPLCYIHLPLVTVSAQLCPQGYYTSLYIGHIVNTATSLRTLYKKTNYIIRTKPNEDEISSSPLDAFFYSLDYSISAIWS